MRSGERRTRPDESVAPLIDREALVLDAFVLHIFQGRIVERALPLEGAVGQATALAQEGGHLIQDCHKVRPVSSLSGARPPCSWQDHHSTRDRKRAARGIAVKSGLRCSVTGLGGMSLHRVLVCPMYTPRLPTDRASARGLLWRTQRISLCRCAPCSALKAGSHVMRWPGTLGARGPPLQRPRAGVSRMALPRHPAAQARLQEGVPG